MAAIAKEGGYLLARNPMEMVSSVFFLHSILLHC